MKEKLKGQKGIALLLAILMVSFVVVMVLFASAMGTGQLKMTGSASDSERAFTAADAGIEYALSRLNLNLPLGCSCDADTWCQNPSFTSNVEYCVRVDNPDDPQKVVAVGRTADSKIRRSLEIILPALAAVNDFTTICYYNNGQNISLNAICTANSYIGATGVYAIGANGTNCASNTSGSAIMRASATNFTLNDRAHFVQCYK